MFLKPPEAGCLGDSRTMLFLCNTLLSDKFKNNENPGCSRFIYKSQQYNHGWNGIYLKVTKKLSRLAYYIAK